MNRAFFRNIIAFLLILSYLSFCNAQEKTNSSDSINSTTKESSKNDEGSDYDERKSRKSSKDSKTQDIITDLVADIVTGIIVSAIENEIESPETENLEEQPVLSKKQARYQAFDQSRNGGYMSGIRAYLGSPTPPKVIKETENETTISLFYDLDLCLGIMPCLFGEFQAASIPITDSILSKMNPYTDFEYNSNETELPGFGVGIGFNKYLMAGRYPKNIFVSAGLMIIPYTVLVYDSPEKTGPYFQLEEKVSGCPYISAGFEQPLSRWITFSVKDTLTFILELNGISQFQNNFYIGFGFISPRHFL